MIGAYRPLSCTLFYLAEGESRVVVGVTAGRSQVGQWLIHFPNHPNSSAVTFRLALRQKTKVRDFRRNEQHRGGIWASRHAGAASDTGGRFHREIRITSATSFLVAKTNSSQISNQAGEAMDNKELP
jgi:hypothetical protein